MTRKAPAPPRADAAPAIVWFRQDLRLGDNPALAAAVASGRPLVLVYVHDDAGPGRRRLGGAQKWWLHQSLARLAGAITARGARLVLRRGPAVAVLLALAAETGAGAVFWNRRYEPAAIAEDAAIKAALKGQGLAVESFNARLLLEPWAVTQGSGGPFKVFTPYWRAALQRLVVAEALPAPARLGPAPAVAGDALGAWDLTPSAPDWASGLRAAWRPGEEGATAQLQQFVDDRLSGYAAARDFPGSEGVSALSPHLAFGEISPFAVWRAVAAKGAVVDGLEADVSKFQSELGWRDFAYHLLNQAPALSTANWRPAFDAFAWRTDRAALRAWRKGLTGYPIVDAGMRQLWATGWMHNRVRMIAASFLIKHLLIDWREGERWFWDTLVDADYAVNAASWQWVAGSGADAAPFFRIFNPVTQGARFDPEGDYVRRWVGELKRLPATFIHQPWAAPADVLAAAGVRLGTDYPAPIVEHGAARVRALAAFEGLKRSA